MLTLLPSTRPREFILDRTNWKYGQQDVNVLLLAVLWRGVAIPLLFELLPHGGSSDTNLRHTLMDDALYLLKPSELRVLYADRAFIGHVWIQSLARRGIPICVQLRSDTLVDEWPARDWLQDLKPGDTGLWVEDVEVCGQPMNVTLTSIQDGEALIIASNARSVTTIQGDDRKRFRIECLFRALKTKGFKLESMHMTLHDHVERLLCLLTLTYVWCVLVGILQECPLERHGRCAWSVVTLGLRALVRSISLGADHNAEGILTLIKLLELSGTA